MRVTPEQLEEEADELLKQANESPSSEDSEAEPEENDGTKERLDTDQLGDEQAVTQGNGSESEEVDPLDESQDSDDLTQGLTLKNAEERIRNAQARMTHATQEAAELRRLNQEQSSNSDSERLKEEVDRLKQEISDIKAKPVAEASNDQSLDAALADYPDVVGPLVAELNKFGDRLGQVEGKVTAESDRSAAEASQVNHEDAIKRSYPDFIEIVRTDDFHGWLKRQVPSVQKIFTTGAPEDCVWLLDQYTAAVGVTEPDIDKPTATPSPARSRNRPPQRKPRFTREQINNMTPQEYEENEGEIDKALESGLIL